MNAFLLVARLVLSVVFFVAAAAKLTDKKGLRRMLVDFGAPVWFSGLAAIILPLAELVLAAALLPVTSAWLASLGVLALLVIFMAAISINLARGKRPQCNCFGQIHSAPIGWSTLARNFTLATLAAVVVLYGRQDAGLSITGFFIQFTVAQRALLLSGLVGAFLLAAQGALLLQVLRQQGRLLLRFESLEQRFLDPTADPVVPASIEAPAMGLPIGTRAPDFHLKNLDAETVGLDTLLAPGKPALLLFTNPECGPCLALMPEVIRWQQDNASRLTVAPVAEGTAEANLSKISAACDHSWFLLQVDSKIADAYQAYGTPAAVLVDADGMIASFVAQGAGAIRELVRRTLKGTIATDQELRVPQSYQSRTGSPSTPTLQIGDMTPSLELQDLDGGSISLNDALDGETLLLFWNPSCGFCQQMLEDLKAWEADRPAGAPALLLISSGTAEENRAMNLSSQVLLDREFRVGAVFGAAGTPMAVLVDSEGRVSSNAAAGAQAVFALARSRGIQEIASVAG